MDLRQDRGEAFTPDAGAMQRAIEAAREGVSHGESPFGACIELGGRVISTAHNRVWELTDITCHAEIVAISEACRRLSAVHLPGAVLYSTCEPCPMCFAAAHWADIARIVYGSGIGDAAGLGFRELTLSNRMMKNHGGSRIEITPGFLRDECLAVFREWSRRADRRTY
ncbi:MAG: nucleoside deaminase [Methanomicrobiales archaeon]|nr:nucleoside deaminase [Methanomicrobiales archaeon]MDI6876955.1 nucleoside deaminase [Methanomicrobiales archaeon]